MTRGHELKCWPEYFAEVKAGRKRFEIRQNDRDFREGDRVVLREYEPSTDRYSGEALAFRIGYMTTWGQVEGVVVFQLEDALASQDSAAEQEEGES